MTPRKSLNWVWPATWTICKDLRTSPRGRPQMGLVVPQPWCCLAVEWVVWHLNLRIGIISSQFKLGSQGPARYQMQPSKKVRATAYLRNIYIYIYVWINKYDVSRNLWQLEGLGWPERHGLLCTWLSELAEIEKYWTPVAGKLSCSP